MLVTSVSVAMTIVTMTIRWSVVSGPTTPCVTRLMVRTFCCHDDTLFCVSEPTTPCVTQLMVRIFWLEAALRMSASTPSETRSSLRSLRSHVTCRWTALRWVDRWSLLLYVSKLHFICSETISGRQSTMLQ